MTNAVTTDSDVPDADWLKAFRSAVRTWYRKHGRDLPWKTESDAYRVWVREIMLQQTTVVAVVPYLERFLTALPTVADLAAADEQDVLKLWEGLGYYSRARNLHKAARFVVDEWGGDFRATAAELEQLPGVGRYTAGAIASFAFGKPAPIVEANTVRLYARLLGHDEDVTKTASQRRLWAFAGDLVPKTKPGSFNQALMDLGATVCRVTEPDCPACPLKSCCVAFEANRVDEIPKLKARAKITELTEACVAIENGGRVLIRQRPDDELWAGLWDFPRFSVDAKWMPATKRVSSSKRDPVLPGMFTPLEDDVCEMTGLRVRIESSHGELRHSVTRYRIRLLCLSATIDTGELRPEANFEWVTPSGLDDFPLTKTAREFANRLGERD